MPTDQPAPAVLYAAKSSEDEHGSIPTQLADCRALAEGEGWEVVGTYQDEGFSAYSGNRGPGLERAREHVTRIGGILVAQHSDRVARGAGDRPDAADHLVEVVASLRRAGAQLRTCQDDFFADPRIGLVMASLMGQRNTEDSARKSEATKSGKRRAWERGDFPGGPIPDGYDVIGKKDERNVRSDPERMKIIRLTGELFDQGWTDSAIARELNRRRHLTQRGGSWRKRRVQDLLTNPLYYGGLAWHRDAPDEEINWDASHPHPWDREDFDRRAEIRAERGTGAAPRQRGRPTTNHALGGLAICGKCLDEGRHSLMRSITSTYRRQDGTRGRTYVCGHVQDVTGMCDAPRIDAEVVDAHVVNELQRYLGDFEAWQDQLLSGYASERQRLERVLAAAVADYDEQERICERHELAIGLAENEAQVQIAMRAAERAQENLTPIKTRLDATQRALDEVPDTAPADAMLDFYSELRAALKGRLDGANTLSRVNDALRDIFESFVLVSLPHDKLGTSGRTIITAESAKAQLASRPSRHHFNQDEGVLVTPVLRAGTVRQIVERATELGALAPDDEDLRPPLRTLHAPDEKSPTRSGSGR